MNIPGTAVPLFDLSDHEDAESDFQGRYFDASANVINPNKDQNKRYFQERIILGDWDFSIPYSQQPNRLKESGPVKLDFPGHFYQVQGGISVIFFEKDRSSSCLCSIIDLDPENETFRFMAFNWIGRSKKTWHESGSLVQAKANSV